LVASQEFDTRIHEIRNEGDVAGQPIQLSNQERPLALPSRLQRLRQLWTVRSLPGLDLDKGCQDGPAMLACESLYGSSLSFQAKAALALSNGANPQKDVSYAIDRNAADPFMAGGAPAQQSLFAAMPSAAIRATTCRRFI